MISRAGSCRSAAGRVAAVLLAALAVFGGVFGGSAVPAARADSPVQLDRVGQITDKVGALGDRRAQVQQSLDQLYSAQQVQLFVVYVRDFSGLSASDWANQTAKKNGLGLNNVLLAVATHDRQFGYSVDAASQVTTAEMNQIATVAIIPPLQKNDWAGAAIGAAGGIKAQLSGQPIPTVAITPGDPDPGASSSSNAADILVPVVVLGAAGAAGAVVYSRRKKKGTHGAGGSVMNPPLLSLKELDSQAKHALVATDDAIRTSEEDLGFAAAEFGDEPAAPFADAVAFAKGELTAAFRLRQQLDDAIPEDDATKRRMLDEIVGRCGQANERLDAQAADFDRLRAVVKNAPQALAQVDAATSALTARLNVSDAKLRQMAERYTPASIAPVAGHPTQAMDRLAFTQDNLLKAQHAVSDGDNGPAAIYIRAAEGGVSQAEQLLDAIDRRSAELQEAADRLPKALTEMDGDLADAAGVLTNPRMAEAMSSVDLQGRVARARSVVAAIQQETAAGAFDPIDALRRVEEADALLDEALDHVREQQVNDQRARSLLDQAALAAQSEIAAAEDVIATQRGAVGSQARTRLAEAQRLLQLARSLADSDPAKALSQAQQADAMARQARQLAEQDAGRYGSQYGTGGAPGRSANGALLGGIILGQILGGGGGGGGGFGGGRGMPSGRGAPGSFGGGGTRGRLGGGGRF